MEDKKTVISELRPQDASAASIQAIQYLNDQLIQTRSELERVRSELEAHIELQRKYIPYLEDKLEERKIWKKLRFSLTDKLLFAIVWILVLYVAVAVWKDLSDRL